jgi:esterase/lipase
MINSKFLASVLQDPLVEKGLTVRSTIVDQQMLRKFRESEQDKVKTPFIMILSGKDQVVKNCYAKDFFDICPLGDKDVVTYEDADHFLMMDNEFFPLVTKDLIGWFNTHI